MGCRPEYERATDLGYVLTELGDIGDNGSPESVMEQEAIRSETTLFCRFLYKIFKESKISFQVFFIWCNEGNNINEALQMTSCVHAFIQGNKTQDIQINWKAPESWRMLMESQIQASMYS
mmetsp:Transcript_25224/g.83357  ORF Transcript_25224/g.83357 Transcript_25224/m.83357 type:complete len:120 (+) Transcript_25224:571-930(+)